ncbi:MAG: hypothetical protein BGO68_00825 [Candidatus Amoebophilus sp. 36-38]|nr:MAG: hypothetical protein BGO68_00825 [Candidatus Amoebophilus sp. 36-38]
MKKYINSITNKNFVLGLCAGIGLCLGLYLSQGLIKKPDYKFNKVLAYIEKYYLEEINKQDLEALTETAIAKLANQLDPHTTYINAQQNAINQPYLQGNFEGIGIEFAILQDTIYVLNSIPHGPAHQAGIQPGDKIIQIDDQSWTKKDLAFNEIIEKMRGPKGSSVKLSIQRNKEKQLLDIHVVRDQIPTQSIEASYMLNNQTGYIKLAHFATHTYKDFVKEINQLREQGMQQLLLDLRDNLGGYLTPALAIGEEMLEPGKLMLYTKGKYKGFNKEYYAEGKNSLQKVPIIILLNEQTASAAELLAGILQDHDRALIVGRRSFGKGLVQWPIEFKDKSVLNLTIERYFMPSGRFIQKPYDRNKRSAYQYDLGTRYQRGEYFFADSIQFDPSLTYKTTVGRTVYGGSGIMPDYFIPLDTTSYSNYIDDLLDNYVIQQYAIEYTHSHEAQLSKMNLEDYAKNFQVTQAMCKQLITHATRLGVQQPDIITDPISASVKHLLKTHIAKVLWQNQGFYQIYNTTDKTILQSLQLFKEAEALLQENIADVAERARKPIN